MRADFTSYCGGVEDDVDIIPVVWDHVLHQAGHGGHNRGRSDQGSLLRLEQESGNRGGVFNVRVKILPQNTFQARINSLPFLFAFLR